MRYDPRKLSFIAIVVAFCLIIVISLFINKFNQEQDLAAWESFAVRFLTDKTKNLYQTFFESADKMEDFYRSNYYYLAQQIDNEPTVDNVSRVGIMIYDVNGQLIFSHRSATHKNTFSDEQVYEVVKHTLVRNDIHILPATTPSGKQLRIAVAPVITKHHKHFVNMIYIFDIDHLYISQWGLNYVNIAIILILGIFLSILYLCAYFHNFYVYNIVNYLRHSFLKRGKKNPHKLYLKYPFEKLEKYITFIISQKNEIEDKYNELYGKFKYLVTSIPEGLVMEDENGFISFCNKRFADMLEYEETELINTLFTDLFYEKEAIDNYKNNAKLRHLNTQYTYKIKFITRTGIQKDCVLTGNVLLGDKGNVVGYYSAITDVTELDTTSHNLEGVQYLRDTFYTFNVNPIIIMDEKEMVVDANVSFINYVQMNKSDIVNKPFDRVITGKEIEKTYGDGKQDFEFYEPSNNVWYYVTTRALTIDLRVYKIVMMYVIDHIKQQLQYHKLILDDSKGFFFVINRKNQVMYISPSFSKITKNTELWFKNYFSSLINNSKSKGLNILEPMIITNDKRRFEFTLNQLYTEDASLIVYQAVLK